jgi:hypothetical protein
VGRLAGAPGRRRIHPTTGNDPPFFIRMPQRHHQSRLPDKFTDEIMEIVSSFQFSVSRPQISGLATGNWQLETIFRGDKDVFKTSD